MRYFCLLCTRSCLERVSPLHPLSKNPSQVLPANSVSFFFAYKATASIDTETSAKIQRVLREEMRFSTVITIAHRVEAVEGADAFIRLGEGKVIEEG